MTKMMCMNCKLVIALIFLVLVVWPAHFCVLAAERLSEIEGKISGEEKNRPIGIPPELITRRLRERDPAFAISVETVLAKLKKKDKTILIDVRNREEFEKFRIPGSINIPLFAIKTKTFLKHKPLVLINDGYHYSPLEQECKRLSDSVFTAVRVLNGGLNAWREKGGALNGDIFAQKELNKMSPQVFFEEKNDESWIVIDVSKPKNPEARYLIPQAISIPFAQNKGAFVSSIKRVMDGHEKSSSLSLLILNENGEQYEKIEKLIEEAGLRNVFYLKEGLMGYKGFLKQQAIMWQPKEHSRKTLKKCPGCP
jgi:rhodanese-related sulfurtransferase